MRLLRFLVVILMFARVAPDAAAQQAAVTSVELGSPDVVLADRFSAIRGLRELSSGALLVADRIEERVALVDLDAATSIDVVTRGQGPGEVRQPAGLVPMPGDSTLLLDGGNARLSVLSPAGRVVRSLRADRPGRTGVRGVAPDGSLIYAIPAWAAEGRTLVDDSVRIVRWRPGDEAVEPLLTIQGTRNRKDRSPSREIRIPVVGYARQDAWTVSPDGSLFVVRGRPYRVERRDSDGSLVVGAPVAFDERRVTDDDRRAFIERFMAANTMGERGPGGRSGQVPSLGEAEIRRLMQTTEFAEVHAPFAADRVVSAPAGGVWVGLDTPVGGNAVYDVFDRQGVRVARVRLGRDRYVAAIGSRGVYVVHTGELGLQSIERYAMPR